MSRGSMHSVSDGGFTLVELLMAIVVLGIIIVPLTNAFIEGLKTTDTTTSVLLTSADRQLVSVYLTPDIQSSTSVGIPGVSACAATPPGTNVARFQWHQFLGNTTSTTTVTNFETDYQIVAIGVPATSWELVRIVCAGAVTQAQKVLARGLQGASAATVAVSGSTVSMAVTDTLGQQYVISGLRRSP